MTNSVNQTEQQNLVSEIKVFAARLNSIPDSKLEFDALLELIALKCIINEKALVKYQLQAA